MLQISYQDDAIALAVRHLDVGQHKVACPVCQHTRSKHRHDRPLSVFVGGESVRWTCWHCGVTGGMDRFQNNVTPIKQASFSKQPKPEIVLAGLDAHDKAQGIAYLRSRGIPDEVTEDKCVFGRWGFSQAGSLPAIGFPYRENGKVVAVKWRSADEAKHFSQQSVCSSFWNLDGADPAKPLIICEGEIDALTWIAAGVDANVVSVPNGAPQKVKDGAIDPSEDRRFAYVWEAKDFLAQCPKVIFSPDKDTAGEALVEELSRRIGKAKCWKIELPEKDANDTLLKVGREALLAAFEAARPIPLAGLYDAHHYAQRFEDLYNEGHAKGIDTGIAALDQIMSISEAMMTVVTGFPGSGKSDLIDQVCINAAKNHNWKTVYCSFEKPPHLHMAQLCAKITGKPFFEGLNPRMTIDERDRAKAWIAQNFVFMDYMAGAPADIDGILEFARAAVMRMGVRILVIDPYNFIEIDYKDRLETDAINQMLTKVQQFAKQSGVHVFFVAHPAKPMDRTQKVVTGLDVAKSMAWFAKADLGLTVVRTEDGPEAHVWKARWQWLGKMGSANLAFDPLSSRWSDRQRNLPQVPDNFDWDI
jgi:twinkle protein